MKKQSKENLWKPIQQQLANARNKKIKDVAALQLNVVFVGINPSLYSAAVGHHFARPGNRFWQALHDSHFTPRLLSPFEDSTLVEHGCGLTNLVARATARANELSDEELRRGAARLQRFLARWRPHCVAFVGITAFRVALGNKHATLGPQPERLGGAMVWVLPNPSGLNAHYQRADFARLFSRLRAHLQDDNLVC